VPPPHALSTVKTGQRRHRVAPLRPQRHPLAAPVPVPTASTVGGSANGIGGLFFFFVLAALLASAGLLRARGISTLHRTVDSAAPQPFLALLERPG
jgi:hypothetical protein